MSDPVPPSDPMPPSEWSSRIKRKGNEPSHKFPPRPEVVPVSESDLGERADGPAKHEGYSPPDAPRHPTPELLRPEESVHPTPELLRPEQSRRPLWRRPPGQKDDLGEPTGSKE